MMITKAREEEPDVCLPSPGQCRLAVTQVRHARQRPGTFIAHTLKYPKIHTISTVISYQTLSNDTVSRVGFLLVFFYLFTFAVYLPIIVGPHDP